MYHDPGGSTHDVNIVFAVLLFSSTWVLERFRHSKIQGWHCWQGRHFSVCRPVQHQQPKHFGRYAHRSPILRHADVFLNDIEQLFRSRTARGSESSSLSNAVRLWGSVDSLRSSCKYQRLKGCRQGVCREAIPSRSFVISCVYC